MLEIKGHEVNEKFTEIELRQRCYEKRSYVTVIITTEFYPVMVNDQIIMGSVQIKLDCEHIHALDDLSEKNFKGNIGSITTSINNNGIWEHQTVESFELTFGKRDHQKLPVMVIAKDLKLDLVGTMTSLYTTSSKEERLKAVFQMEDFYPTGMKREIGKSTILKYYVKSEKESS